MAHRIPHRSRADRARFLLRLLAPVAWLVIMFWLSLTSSPPQISGVLGWDKLLHAGAYGLLCLLIMQFLFYALGWACPAACRLAGVIALCYGGLLEVLQLLAHTGRTAEWGDLLADAAGILAACVVFCRFVALSSRRHVNGG